MLDPRELIDCDRYPIEDPASAARKALIERCRADLDRAAICTLEDFVRPEVVTRMAEEAGALTRGGYRNENPRTAYGWMYNRDFPQGHPRAALFPHANRLALTHQLPGDSLVEQLYGWDPLTDFVRDALGFETLYRCACPHLSLTISSMAKGDRFGWHFDTNDGVVSLLLQTADEGGEFECAPYIRTEEDENYETVARLFAGEAGIAVKPRMTPGTFVLFKGRRSCHRVTEVGETGRPRLIALFSYDEEPGMVFPESTARDLMSSRPEPYYGQAAP